MAAEDEDEEEANAEEAEKNELGRSEKAAEKREHSARSSAFSCSKPRLLSSSRFFSDSNSNFARSFVACAERWSCATTYICARRKTTKSDQKESEGYHMRTQKHENQASVHEKKKAFT